MTHPLFEHTTCPRCGGCGRYSYNQMDGDRCYGCNGTGYKLTKRGHAAQQYLNAMRVSPASEIKVGDLILWDMYFGKPFYAPVLEIAEDKLNAGMITLSTERNGERYGIGCHTTSPIKRGFTAEQKESQRQAALAYQATLTKAGKPAKK